MKGILLVFDESALTTIGGLTIVARALSAGSKAGVRDWLVLTATPPARLRRLLKSEAEPRGVVCRTEPYGPEARSVLAEALGEDLAILVPCTAVVDYRTIRAVVGCDPRSPALCAFRPQHGPDQLFRGTSAALGAVVEALFSLREPVVEPEEIESLSDGLWLPLSSGRKEIERKLFASLGQETDGFLAHRVDRRLSQALTRRLADTSVTPNQLTLVSLLLGLLSAWLLTVPDYLTRAIGAAVFLVSTTVDGCDGELARVKYLESEFGARFDLIADNIVHVVLFPAIAYGLYRQTGDGLYLVLGAVTVGGIFCAIAVASRAISRFSRLAGEARESLSSMSAVYERLTARDFSYVLLAITLLDRLVWFVWLAAIGTYLFAGGLLAAYLWTRRASAPGRA